MSIRDSQNTLLSRGEIPYPDTRFILEWEHKVCVGQLLSLTDKNSFDLDSMDRGLLSPG
jgi:hypothetical protein